MSAPLTSAELPDVEIDYFTVASMPDRFASGGDLHVGIDGAVWSVEPLPEWADRDERDHGLGGASDPPNFPSRSASNFGCSRHV